MSSDSVDKIDKKYIAFIRNKNLDNELFVTVVDLATQKNVPCHEEDIDAKDVKRFLNDIPSKFGKNFKAIIVCVTLFNSPDFTNNLEFCKSIREKLELINVPYHFIHDKAFLCILPVYAANITVKIGETITTAVLMNSTINTTHLKLTQNGYEASKLLNVPINMNDTGKKIRAKIIGTSNAKELIITAERDDLSKMEKLKKKLSNAHYLLVDDLM